MMTHFRVYDRCTLGVMGEIVTETWLFVLDGPANMRALKRLPT